MLRLRTLAAAAILFAGITVGFTLGRMSVWLFATGAPNGQTPAQEAAERGAPLAPKATAAPGAALPAQGAPTAAATTPPPTPPPTMAPKTAPSPLPTPSATAPAAADNGPAESSAGGRSQAPPKPVVAPNWRAAAGDPSGSVSGNAEDSSRAPNVKLINPGEASSSNPGEPERSAAAAGPTKPAADVAESETDRQDIAACERRYSSFRRSDGTYQPFGGGARLRCPLLR
jgi:BA14K-like protein